MTSAQSNLCSEEEEEGRVRQAQLLRCRPLGKARANQQPLLLLEEEEQTNIVAFGTTGASSAN